MTTDAIRPPQHVRDGLVAGQLAELVALPVLFAVALLFHQELRWGYLAGALACVFFTLLYFALFLVLTGGRAEVRGQQTTAFVLSCLAIATLGLLELGTSDPFGTFLPGCLVVVVFISIVGDRNQRVAIDGAAIVAVGLVGWKGGLGGADLAAVILVYAACVVLITWLIARTVASLSERVVLDDSAEALDEALRAIGNGPTDTNGDFTQEILRRGLPLVSTVLPAQRITVFVRQGDPSRSVSLATWPEGAPDVCSDPDDRPEVVDALRSERAVTGDDLTAIPIGYCAVGPLVMVVQPLVGPSVRRHGAEAAQVVASAFLRATSRAAFVSGARTESRSDPLTGLPSRRILFERIEIEMEHALRSETPLSVAMIDLDHFKHYNDQHGPVAGDTVLRSIAALLVSNIRGQDLVVRYGGEEFCLVMPETDILGAHHLLDKLRDGGRDATSQFGVTLSAGLTSWDGIEDTASMIERAGEALYRAKQTGRNRVVSIQSVTDF